MLVFLSEIEERPTMPMDEATKAVLRSHVRGGGRLLLLGFATSLVHEIGIEPSSPDRFGTYRWGTSSNTALGHYAFGTVAGTVEAKPLEFRSEFDYRDGECHQIVRFLENLNASCGLGDLAALEGGLTPVYRRALEEQVMRIGRQFGAETLRQMVTLVPVPDSTSFVMGRSHGDRIAVVVGTPSLQFELEATQEECLTCIPIMWDGNTFRLAKPQWRHVHSSAIRLAAADLCDEWLHPESRPQ